MSINSLISDVIGGLFGKSVNIDILKEYNNRIGLTKDSTKRLQIAEDFLTDSTVKMNDATRNAIIANKGNTVALEKYSMSAQVAAIKTKLLNAALNVGILLAVSAAIKIIVNWWDEYNVTVEETVEKVDKLKSTIKDLQDEYDTLSKKQGLTSEEIARLNYLNDRIKLEKELLKLQEQERINTKLGNNKKTIFGLYYKVDKDALDYQANEEFGSDYDYFKTHIKDNRVSALSEYVNDLMEYKFSGESVESFDTDNLYSKLLNKYKDFTEKIEDINKDLNNEYVTEDQKKQLEEYLSLYKNGAEDVLDSINKLAITLDRGDWIINIGLDLDFTGLSKEEIQTKLDAYVSELAERYTVDEPIIRKLFKLDLVNFEDYISPSGAKNVSKEFTGFTEEQSKAIDEFQSKIDSLGNTLKSFRNGEEINLADLIQEFPELASQTDNLDQAITNLINGSLQGLKESLGDVIPPEVYEFLSKYTDQITEFYPKLTTAYSEMHNIYDIMQTVKEEFDETTGIDHFTDSTLQSIAGINEYMNTLVAGWHANGVSSQELFDALQDQYQTDLRNYGQALIAKNSDTESFYKSVGMMNTDVVNEFKESYEIDLKNCKSYNDAKREIEANTLNTIANIWGKYYDIQTKQLTSQAKAMKAVWDALPEGDARTSVYLSNPAYKELLESIDMMEKYKRDIEALNQLIYKGVGANFESVSSKMKDTASSTASEFNELFDFFERRIEVIDQALSKLDSSLENVNGSIAKNILVSGKLDIVSKEIKDYSSALSMYQQKANEELSKLNSDLQEKIKNGAVNITQLIGKNGEQVNEVLTSYQNWANKVNDCNQKLIELKETLRDLALDKFNNIVQEYSDRFDIIDFSKSLIDKQLNYIKESGELVGSMFYKSQINLSQKQLAMLEKEKMALANELSSSISSGNIQKGTDEWLEMVKAINDVDLKILDCKESVESLNNSLLELHDLTFEKVQKQFSNISSEITNIIGLMSDAEVSSEDGIWTDEGLTQLGSYAQMYELAQNNVKKYADEIEYLNNEYIKGSYSTDEYLEKLSELSEAQWGEINASESAKKSILDLNKARIDVIKDGINKQIEAYRKLINTQKEALDKEKDLHGYEKSISDKTKDIEKIKRKINALSGDTSLAANTKRLKLEQELVDAQKDLEETQYDHSVEAQKEALDKQLEDYEDARQKEIDILEEYLKDANRIYTDSLNTVKNNTNTIYKQIADISKKYGIQISSAITNAWKAGEDAVASHGSVLNSSTTKFVGQLDLIENRIIQLQNTANVTAGSLLGMLSVKSDVLSDQIKTVISDLYELQIDSSITYDELVKMLSAKSGILPDQIKTILNGLFGLQTDADFTYDKLMEVLTAKSDVLLKGIDLTGIYLSELQDEANFTSDRLTDMLSTKADKLLEEFDVAMNSENDLVNATMALNNALVQTLSGSYDISGIISSLNQIINTANQASTAVSKVGGSGSVTSTNNSSQQSSSSSSNSSSQDNEALRFNIENGQKYAQQIEEQKREEERKRKQQQKENEIRSLEASFGYSSYYDPHGGRYSQKYYDLSNSARSGDHYANTLKYQIDQAVKDFQNELSRIYSKYAGYANGVRNLSTSQYAWTQELGREAILSPTRNAVFTKLNKGDTVLTKEQTDNLFRWGKISPEYVLKNTVMHSISKNQAPTLTIGNILTVNGSIDDGNVEKMKAVATTAINEAFKKFSNEIKR